MSARVPPLRRFAEEPHKYRIEPADRWGWWVTVHQGVMCYPPDWRRTLAGAHRYGQRRVLAEQRRDARKAIRKAMI